MISTRTKTQLMVFVLITLVGISFVGARYAKLGRLFYDSDYTVNAEFAQSGGIFTGAEVDYRGVEIGRVANMKVTRKGVDVVLSIEKSQRRIPSDVIAQVADRSAVGEQYVDLQPQTDKAPYLENGSKIATPDTVTPVSTTELLTNLDQLVNSVPQQDLRTVVSELGAAFEGTGASLGQIIDTSNAFIKSANDNFDTTTALIRDANTVLTTQADKASAIRTFSKDLSLFTGTLAGSDKDLRAVIDNGAATTQELESFLKENQVDLGQLINNLVTTGQIVVKHLKGLRQILVIYPYMVAGAYTVVQKGPGGYDARFGLVLTQTSPVCHQGYGGTKRRSASQTSEVEMNTDAHCSEPASQSDARGAAHAPNGRTGADYGAPVASYDSSTGRLTWIGDDSDSSGDSSGDSNRGNVVYDGGAQSVFGSDSGQWLLLQTLGDSTGVASSSSAQ